MTSMHRPASTYQAQEVVPRRLLAFVVVLVLGGACSSAAPGTEAGGAAPATRTAEPAMGVAAWTTLPLVDARTGETFRIADSAGKPVFLEAFATWCSNCRRQLGFVQEVAAGGGVADTQFVALSVETDLTPERIAEYAADEGFDDVRFAVMTPEMLAAVKDAFGTSALNPPSTPHVYIGADGRSGELVTGFEEPGVIRSKLAPPAG